MAITDPRDIAGLLVWFSAEYEAANYTNGADLTLLTDLSGNGNNATVNLGAGYAPTWYSTGGPAGGARIRVNPSTDEGYLLPSGLMTGKTSGEVMQYAKIDALGNSHYRFGSGTSNGHYGFTNGDIYDEFGSTTRKQFTPSLSLTTWRRYNVWSAASDFAARLDETNQFTTTSNTVGWRTQPVIFKMNGSNTAGCDFSAFVLYDHKLTTTERADLAAWLAANPSGGAPAVNPSGALAAALPAPVVDLAGTYASPTLAGTLAAVLPVPTVGASGFYVDPGAQAAGSASLVLPLPGVVFAGDYTPAGGSGPGDLVVTLPAPTLTLAGRFYSRNGYGLVLDSESTVDAEAPLPATPSDTGVPALTLHVVTPTVPTPVLVNGRPS